MNMVAMVLRVYATHAKQDKSSLKDCYLDWTECPPTKDRQPMTTTAIWAIRQLLATSTTTGD